MLPFWALGPFGSRAITCRDLYNDPSEIENRAGLTREHGGGSTACAPR